METPSPHPSSQNHIYNEDTLQYILSLAPSTVEDVTSPSNSYNNMSLQSSSSSDIIQSQTDTEPALFSADNPFITTGFRNKTTIQGCLWSMFQWHNQTINIWTSVGLVSLHIIYAARMTQFYYSQNYPTDIIVFLWIYGGLRAISWIGSWIYHTFNCITEESQQLLCKVDYIGCIASPFGMGTTIIYIELYDNTPVFGILATIGGCIMGGAAYLVLDPKYQNEEKRIIRFFVLLGTLLPYMIGLYISVVDTDSIPFYYIYLVSGGLIELLGAFFYMSMIPERWITEIFDCLGSSHNLWHFSNIGMDILLFLFLTNAVENRVREGNDE